MRSKNTAATTRRTSNRHQIKIFNATNLGRTAKMAKITDYLHTRNSKQTQEARVNK
jgi:hypothetical protein